MLSLDQWCHLGEQSLTESLIKWNRPREKQMETWKYLKLCHRRTQVEMLQMDKRRIRGAMTAVFKYWYGCQQEEVFKFIHRAEPEAIGTSYREKILIENKKLSRAAQNETGCPLDLKMFEQGWMATGWRNLAITHNCLHSIHPVHSSSWLHFNFTQRWTDNPVLTLEHLRPWRNSLLGHMGELLIFW